MKKRALVTVVILLLVLSGMVTADPIDVNLIADGGDESTQIDIGHIDVSNDGTNLYISYIIDEAGWVLVDTKLHVTTGDPEDKANIPQTKKHNPKPGKFDYKEPDPGYTDTQHDYTIALGDIGVTAVNDVNIAAHAEVLKSSNGNALQNSGAEAGDMSFWTATSAVRAIDERVESTGTVQERSGDYFFDMTAEQASSAEMYQEIDVSGYDGGTFDANGWIQTELYPFDGNTGVTENDYGELVLTFLDGGAAVLETFSTGPIGNPVHGTGADGYVLFSLQGTIPYEAVTAKYLLKGTLVGGSYVNVFYDDLSLSFEREETAWGGTWNYSTHELDLQFSGSNWAAYFTYTVQGD